VKALSLATRLSVALPREIRFRMARLSPDGSALVCLGRPRESAGGAGEAEPMLYVRKLNSFEATPLAGTEGALGFVVSREGRYVFFVAPASPGSAKSKLLKAPLDGSTPPIPLTDWKDNWGGGVAMLNSGDLLVMMDQGTSYLRVPGGGGEPTAPIKTDAGAFRGTLTPTDVLPGDKGILLNGVSYGARGWYYQIGLMDPATGKVRFLLDDGGNAVYSPTGHLLFARGDVLLAAPFDLGRQAITGPPVAVLRGLLTFYSVQPGSFTLANNGTLAHRPGGAILSERQLVLMDPNGVVKPWSAERRPYAGDPVLSRDGREFAVTISNAQGIDECWVSEVDRPALRRAVAIPDADCDVGAMSPDGQWLAYRRNGRDARDGVYLGHADGRGEPKLILKDASPGQQPLPVGWSPDGSALLITVVVDGRPHLSVIRAPLAAGPTAEPAALISGFVDEYEGTFSPDGGLLAFTSNESGKSEVYVCSYQPDGSVGDPVRASTGGGHNPHWTSGGKRLLYIADPGRLMSVAVATAPAVTAGAPAPIANLDQLLVNGGLSVLPDGRMLGIQTSDLERSEVTSVNLVLDLFDELKRASARGK
jgi:Tol biopolymer transport system component